MGAVLGFKRFVLVLPLLVLGSLLGAATVRADQAPAPAPPDRLHPWTMHPENTDLVGLRSLGRTSSPLVTGFPITVDWPDAMYPPDPGEPPFVQPVASSFSNCGPRDAPPEFGYHASWFEITTGSPDLSHPNGLPFSERTVVTLDTGDSSFNALIAVYSGQVPDIYNPASLALNVVACDRGTPAGGSTSLSVPAFVSFVAQPGQRYFAEVASQTNFVGSLLWLYLRELDVQPPAVRVSTLDQNQAQPGEVMSFDVAWPDTGSGVPENTAGPGPQPVTALVTTTALAGTPVITLKARTPPDTGSPCPTLGVGEYCLGKDTLKVRWPAGSTIVTGRVDLTATDRAGNLGTASLSLRVRDRTAPIVSFKKLKSVGRTATVSASCNERGRLWVYLFGPGPDRKAVTSIAARRTGSLRFTRLRSGFYLIHVQCEDLSHNRGSAFRGLLVR